MAFENFVAIQNAWMEFDYDKLRELCTDELYNTYTSQLDTLKIKNGKNVMSDFDQEEIKIMGIKKQDKLVTVEVYLRITFYDYVINQKSKEVIRGTKDHKLTNNYEMQFVRKQDNSKKKTKCPNCGAEIDTVTSTKCEYCGSTIVVDANEFVLSKKTNINR
jgi:predicted lipid-binding transport protein (Tim44 family)